MSRTKDTIESVQIDPVDRSVPEPRIVTVDVTEWEGLAARLAIADPVKYEELLVAMRQIVDHQETLAAFDWQLFFGIRPSSSKRYLV